ncbi:hypothetical protein AB0J86_14330 [Micromonospora sp. NPDC049559]|uniref:glycosyltransferase n=1 Tax=Micromonospora sp. NPDC049559 TaxID=3155923 RepID=UPI0034361D31
MTTAAPGGDLAFSNGNVVEVRPSGPLFRRYGHSRRTHPSTFLRTLRPRDWAVVVGIAAGWLVAFAAFWLWWWRPEHRAGWPGLVTASVLMLYLTGLPGHHLRAVLRMRHVNPAIEALRLRIAFLVTRAATEPWPMARRTLKAMLDQRISQPYDVWLCDESPSPEILRWCGRNGVRVSSRRGVPDYHRDGWPRRAGCKEGNLAYFYDHWGYRDYDVVAQLDCDHVPYPTYLAAVVRPFADPAIGYVAAPDVCDANTTNSWVARGRLHREAPRQGPVQLGHNQDCAPLAAGSHHAVRTRALRDIGGPGPERVEAVATTFLLSSAGWRGAYAVEAEAHGDGPLTVTDMAVQEFQRARDRTGLLLTLAPAHLGRFGTGLRLRFAVLLGQHPLLVALAVALLAGPALAALTGRPWVDVDGRELAVHLLAVALWLPPLRLYLRHVGLLRPAYAPVLSWEAVLYALVRWPWVAAGVLSAAVRAPRTGRVTVTPKYRTGREPLPVRLVAPYLAITVLLATAALVGELKTGATGSALLCLLGAAAYGAAGLAVPLLYIAEAARARRVRFADALDTARTPLLLGAFALLLPLAAALAALVALA